MATNPNYFASWAKQSNAYAPRTPAPTNTFSQAVATPPPSYTPNATNSSGYSASRVHNTNTATPATPPPSSTYTPGPGPGINQLSLIPTSTNNTLQNVGKLANSQWQAFGPLQQMTANLYQAVLSGHSPEAIMPLLGPILAHIASQQATAQRQIRDTTSGGNEMQGLADSANASIGAGANAYQQMLQQLIGGAMQQGTNVAQQAAAPLLGMAQARLQQHAQQLAQQQAQSGGLFGGLF